MTATAHSNKACDLILFGTKGDLARRKLLPALYQLEMAGLLHADSRITGVARDDLTQEGYLEVVETNLQKFVKEPLDADVLARLKTKLQYVQIDLTKEQDYLKLADVTDIKNRIPVSYFATAPSLFGNICKGLDAAGLSVLPSRVVLEKPIGHCLESSKVINDEVAKYFKESQIYRIDHYLGKEAIQNLMVMRFANIIFEPVWNRNYIESVTISWEEDKAIGDRGGYFDDAGIIRDVIQNHLLQILALVAMEQPSELTSDEIASEKNRVLRKITPFKAEDIVVGQYTDGVCSGRSVNSYRDEPGVPKDSMRDTFAAVRCEINNQRWSGVPFVVKAGKAMTKSCTEIITASIQLPKSGLILFNPL